MAPSPAWDTLKLLPTDCWLTLEQALGVALGAGVHVGSLDQDQLRTAIRHGRRRGAVLTSGEKFLVRPNGQASTTHCIEAAHQG